MDIHRNQPTQSSGTYPPQGTPSNCADTFRRAEFTPGTLTPLLFHLPLLPATVHCCNVSSVPTLCLSCKIFSS
ncbi:hypothetical protein GOP47_0012324 [Adiantum capillus-veneris]|uniref:Uncharacterized protein n=1 Tax=Adiantum capillus-veneris TaxID=13818 RepID=A0A9D4ZE75_ADICA|nr:hypothetical protein GOP47_0012324 [Adiantum capillus-veneris]